MKLWLITPPFTQLNTPYPATAWLQGFLKRKGKDVVQSDLSIEVFLALFSKDGLSGMFAQAAKTGSKYSDDARRMLALKDRYIETIDLAIKYLQGDHPALAQRICQRHFLPEGRRFAEIADIEWTFGTMGIRDQARHLVTLYLEDLGDFIIETTDPHFGFSRYAERLGRSACLFDELDAELQAPPTFTDKLMFRVVEEKMELYQPDVVGISIPFPGNLYAGLRCGQWIKSHFPQVKVVMGGGFVSTELRWLSEPAVFKYVDFITLDDGEIPLLHLMEHLEGTRDEKDLTRTFTISGGSLHFVKGESGENRWMETSATPDYRGLPLSRYLSAIEIANPMHRLWSDGRWNKLALAHGCYWAKCSFCDTSLDYIGRYQPGDIQILCRRIEEVLEQTGEHGFHFVDEAAPPALLRDLSMEIIRRGLQISWWTNIRFEKNFTTDLCLLMREAGCIAVSGGLEVASPRILSMINKGVTVEQVARVASNFTRSGIMVHAYLMYGFPTQTTQETIDSLEVVRQMFGHGVLQSGFWHRFALTAHSPVGIQPEKFGIKIHLQEHRFAWNDVDFDDPSGCSHADFAEGLKTSLFNFMHDVGLDFPLQDWFAFKTPPTRIAPDFIENILKTRDSVVIKSNTRLFWTDQLSSISFYTKKKKDRTYANASLSFYSKSGDYKIEFPENTGKWMYEMLSEIGQTPGKTLTFDIFKQRFEQELEVDLDTFLHSQPFQQLRRRGLFLV